MRGWVARFDKLNTFTKYWILGDELWGKYCNDRQNISNAMRWETLDWYKGAVLKTREVDVEMEAIALSQIGKFYDVVFKLKPSAKKYFKRSIQLAGSLHPRTFDKESKCFYREQCE